MCAGGARSGRLPETFGVREFAEASNVSRETLARLEAYVTLLIEWNARQNMVSKASLADVWQRHVWDSAQLAPLVPEPAKTLVDLGSGAGFPALVLAAMRPAGSGVRLKRRLRWYSRRLMVVDSEYARWRAPAQGRLASGTMNGKKGARLLIDFRSSVTSSHPSGSARAT